MTRHAQVGLLLVTVVSASSVASAAGPPDGASRLAPPGTTPAAATRPPITAPPPTAAPRPDSVLPFNSALRPRDEGLRRTLATSGTYAIDGISDRSDGDFVAASINIHLGGIPGDRSGHPSNESVHALLDDARHVNSGNPDVVFVQEMRSRPADGGRPGIAETPSLFGRLIHASDMAFTPALEHDPRVHAEQYYGTAIYVRNGHTLGRVVNAALANPDGAVEPRSFGVAEVAAPNGERFTVISTHLHTFIDENYHPELAREGGALRERQLADIAKAVTSLRQTGSFVYRDALTGAERVATGFPKDVRLVGGDFNQKKAPSDAVLTRAGLTHVNDLLYESAGRRPRGETYEGEVFSARDSGMKGTPHLVDQLYAPAGSKYEVADVVVGEIPRHHHDGPSTDHKPVWVRFRRAAPSTSTSR